MFLATSYPQATAAKPGSVPLPDANPKRELAAPAPKAAEPPDRKPAFNAKRLLGPVLDFELTKQDRANLKAAISGFYKHRFSDGLATAGRIKDKHARKLAYWYYYRSSGLHAPATEIEAFRIANPHWPGQRRLRRNAERALFLKEKDPAAIESFFAEERPQSGAGRAALAVMHRARGDKEKAREAIAFAWRNHNLSEELETAILKRFGSDLSDADHRARVDRLLYQDRKSRLAAALRTAKLLPEQEQKKIKARVAVVRRSKAAKKLLDAIPDEHANGDVGLYFSRIQWLRRHDREKDAWTLLRYAPNEPEKQLDLDEWWVERRINCRSALNAGHAETAYEIASNHGPLKGRSYTDAEFLAGWIALRFLGRIEAAHKHFLALRTAALSPKTIARAEYWLGRTARAAGKPEEAEEHFAKAAEHTFTYYGQLARQSLAEGPASLPIAPAPRPTAEDAKRFASNDAVMAIGVIRDAGFISLSHLFFHQLARTLESPAEVVLLAELGRAVGQPHASVRLGKIAFNRGQPTAEYAFPVGLLPDYKKLNGAVEDAFLHALSRQESEFNPDARSPVGARGLMQLMPGTARAVARQYKVRYRRSRLTKDPAYNVMLGVAHLRDLLDSYDGSYILSLAAYNAGGGRVRDWQKQFGDPRQPGADPIDWVERIPFTETREYVQKILTTVQIFRSRLEGPEGALRLMQDLYRYNPPGELPKEASNDAATASAASN